MDACRQHLDVEIERTKATASMLVHLADAIEHGPSQTKGETYQADAVEALVHAAEIVRQKARNLRHCGSIYDRLADEPVPEPAR